MFTGIPVCRKLHILIQYFLVVINLPRIVSAGEQYLFVVQFSAETSPGILCPKIHIC